MKGAGEAFDDEICQIAQAHEGVLFRYAQLGQLASLRSHDSPNTSCYKKSPLSEASF